MTIIIPHGKTAEEAMAIVDRSANTLFESTAGPHVQLTDKTRSWNGPTMNFGLTARLGFIAVPISGTIVVDAINVTVNCVLPALVNQFIGEEKIRAGLDRRVRAMLTPQVTS
jgi:hypothetical protein